jgi:hypothetical protein
MKRILPALLFFCSLLCLVMPVVAEEETETTELAKAAQNPVASMISVPFQSNFNFGMGQEDKMGYILNIQPIIPMKLNDRWNLITRIVTPISYLPELTDGGEDYFGFGDINPQFYFATISGKLIWGAGPQFQFPTASYDQLGSEKYAAGPAAVVLTMDGPWVYGALANNLWSFAGNDDRRKVNSMTLQPFVNYNLPKGWYLSSSPVITANWVAVNDDDIWTVPVGAGIGKIIKIGNQPVNISLGFYDYVEHPSGAADWQIKFQVQLMFPIKK